MATSITVTVERIDAENWLGDTSGVDVDATVEQYAELLETAITAAYPNAEVEVVVDRHSQTISAGRTEIESDDLDEDEEEKVRGAVASISNAVFDGRHGDYLVLLQPVTSAEA